MKGIGEMNILNLSPESVTDILTRMSEPHRHYHNTNHVQSILLNLHDVCSTSSEMYSYMVAAAWLHDVIYDVQSSTNEEDSALYSRGLGLDLDHDVLSNIILATRHHQPNTPMEAVFCDLDMMILASHPVLYQGYSKAIRQEYHHIDDKNYQSGRGQFLTQLLDRTIFHTMPQLEKAAKANIEHEIANLSHL